MNAARTKDYCLEPEPLQLEADIWGLIEKFPDTYALILSNSEGGAVELPGARLCAMPAGGEIIFYPASYRIARKDSQGD